MIQVESVLKVADNTGAVKVYCIKVLGKSYAGVGDKIVVSVIEAAPKSKVEKGKVYKAVVVRSKSSVIRADGVKLRFDDNSAVLINNQLEPIGTRVFGIVPREVSIKAITSLAPEVI